MSHARSRYGLWVLSPMVAPHALMPASGPSAIEWMPLNEPGVRGSVLAISVSPFDSRRILASGDMLGVALSTDGGATWQATTGFSTWEMSSFTGHPNDPLTVWVGSMSGPYGSTDGAIPGRPCEPGCHRFLPITTRLLSRRFCSIQTMRLICWRLAEVISNSEYGKPAATELFGRVHSRDFPEKGQLVSGPRTVAVPARGCVSENFYIPSASVGKR